MSERIARYRDFWPYYLREHAKPGTRRLHLFGTALATLSLVAFVVTAKVWLVLVALVAGYAPAWTAHFLVERNRPATFRYPLWSLASDYRMAWEWLTGHLNDELSRAGVPGR